MVSAGLGGRHPAKAGDGKVVAVAVRFLNKRRSGSDYIDAKVEGAGQVQAAEKEKGEKEEIGARERKERGRGTSRQVSMEQWEVRENAVIILR